MKKKQIYLAAFTLLVVLIAGAAWYGYKVVYKERQLYQKYQQAFELYKNKDYEQAEEILLTMEDYEGVSVLLKDICYQKGVAAFEAGEYESVRELLSQITDYQDSLDYVEASTYQLAVDAYVVQDYDTAENYFSEIADYKDVRNYMEEIAFHNLKQSFQAGYYMECESSIFKIPDYPGVEPYGIVVLEAQGKEAYEAQQYERALEMYRYALEYGSWLDIYNEMTQEEKAAYAAIAGETDFKQRLKNIETERALAQREYQALLCLKELVKYYENNKAETAELVQVDEIRFAKQAYTNEAEVPVVMIAFQEKVNGKKQQAYAVYNETELYGICSSLKMEEIDKADSVQLQAHIKISGLWEQEDTVKIDMQRIRKAIGWE